MKLVEVKLCYNIDMKFVYTWSIRNEDGTLTPFYVGQGVQKQHNTQLSKYARAYVRHLEGANGKVSPAQIFADYLASIENPHVVDIVADNLSEADALSLEKELIAKYGRKCVGEGELLNVTAGGETNPMHEEHVRELHLIACRSEEHRKRISEASKNRSQEYIEKQRAIQTAFYADPKWKAGWYDKTYTPEVREKIKAVQSDINGVKIEHNGVTYRSKKELARVLGISSQLLNYRITNNIPLDVTPSKANRKGKDF